LGADSPTTKYRAYSADELMKQRLRGLLENLSLQDALLGALVGLVLSAAIQPFALAFFTDVWVEVGAPGHTPPPVNSDLTKLQTGHYDGENVEQYDNLTWREGYETYRVVIENEGGKPVYNLKARIPLPGCIIGVSKDTPFSEGDYDLTDQISAGVGGNRSTERYQCSKIINADQLFPGEKIVVDFVIEDEFESCDVLAGVHGTPELITEYQWRKTNQIYSEVSFDSVPDLKSEFSQFREANSGTMIEAGSPHGRVYGVLIPYNLSNVSNPRGVLDKCHLTLPDES